MSKEPLFALLDEVTRMFQMRADAKGILLQMGSLTHVPRYIVTDQNRLRQILINLLGNAMKFTEHGTILVNIHSEYADAVNVMLKIDIQDSGPGIASEDIPKLFQQYEQTKSGEKVVGGTGLGLAISRQLARLMDGDITIQSTLGVGSTFTVSIQTQRSDSERALKSVEEHGLVGLKNPAKQYRVLIVDDKDENRKLLAQILEPLRFMVDFATNGQEAVDLAMQQNFDLILMDLRMPIMDGCEAIRTLRSKKNLCKTIMLSASAFEETRVESLNAGANAFLGKPFREIDLLNLIGSLLQVEYIGEPLEGQSVLNTTDDALPLPKLETHEEDIAKIGPEARQKIFNAVVAGDFDQFEGLISAVGLDPATLHHLRMLADVFDVQTLQELFSR